MSSRWMVVLLLCLATPVAAQSTGARSHTQVLIARGEAYEKDGQLDAAARTYTEARIAAERAGDRGGVADALTQLGYLHYFRGSMNEALVVLRTAYDTAVALGDASRQREALNHIAHVYADSKIAEYDRAIEYYRQLLPQYEKAREPENVADTLFNIGSTFQRKDDFQEALGWYRRALAAEEKLGRREEAAVVKRSVAMTLGSLGRSAEALPLLDESLAVFTAAKATANAMSVRQSRGIINLQLGRIEAAIADLEETRRGYSAQKNTRFLEKTEDELAAAYAAAERWRDAYLARSRHTALQRELAEKLREEHSSRLRVQFDAERKEQENRALLRDAAAAARIRRLQTIILALGAAIILVLAYLALRLVRDTRRMRAMAMTDELTRLPNRRHLLARGTEELRGTLSLLALDIDHFKRVNDTWGHAAGDLALQRVAHACRATLRPTDVIGRTGGEEFTVLLPATTAADAEHIAERLRAAVAAIDCSDIDPSLRITISIGIAETAPGDDTIEKLLARADQGLYLAKASGRDRVARAS
jgi:diguanylate cyclase (GGDEF)-like protein